MNNTKKVEPTTSEVLNYMRMNGIYNKLLREIQAQKITSRAACETGLKVSDEELQRAADAFRLLNNLEKASVFKEWLTKVDMSLEDFEEFLERNILVSKFKNALAQNAQEIDFLSRQEMKELLRDIIYQDWLKEHMK